MITSIKIKITFWYVLTLSLSFFIFSILIHNNLKRNLYENIDRLLEISGENLSDNIENYIEMEWPLKKDDLQSDKIISQLQLFLRGNSYNPKFAAIEVRVMDLKGETVISKKYQKWHLISKQTLENALNNIATYDTLTFKDSIGKKSVFRSYITPVIHKNKPFCIVQAYMPTYQMEFALKNLRIMLLISVPLITILIGGIGIIVIRVAIKPINKMIKTAKLITAENLSLRLPPSKSNDEIHELSEIFNDMLSRLEESFLSQKRFIQDISHELKTPLTIIRGELEVTLKTPRSAEEYQSILMSGLEETKRLSKLVEGLLTLARFDNKEISLNFLKVNVKETFEHLKRNLFPMWSKKHISVSIACPQELEIYADEDKIKRSFFNILENSIKYTETGGKIKINAYQEKEQIFVEINDTGQGISSKDIPHIFKRFYRADTSRSSKGFGLGLAITKSLIDAHGAKIKVESIPHKGTSFIVSFPFKP
ncbi:MAG: HAMP domain-containing histidine kinase [Elusimicrobia bacterium]|nr:HAMP domain-containing histidine kinase [Elusimicrobiota bacterium]